MIGSTFHLGVLQFAPELYGPEANARHMSEVAAGSGADLVLTPELSLTGYNVGDEVFELAVPVEGDQAPWPFPVAGHETAPDLLVGMIERGSNGVPYNAAVHLRGGTVVHKHRKVYLPTYGMFDEGRFFGRGGRIQAYDAGGGWRVGVLICEDFWHPSLIYLLAMHGIHLLLVQAAGPGRGAWAGGEDGGRFATSASWERIACYTAQMYGIYVALANRVGVEGGVVFGGGSLIVDPSGDVLERAPTQGESLLVAELALERVYEARRPGAHIRDEDPHFVVRELNRLLEAQR